MHYNTAAKHNVRETKYGIFRIDNRNLKPGQLKITEFRISNLTQWEVGTSN